MRQQMEYFYGPVHSRRLGLSLGVDLFSRKICNFNCVYCQLGPTERVTVRRASYADLKEFSFQFKKIISSSPALDYVTFSGSGEPTLHEELDRYIAAVKRISSHKYPVCVITNSSLLYRRDVRREIIGADLIVPSLDAPSEEIFRKINRPAPRISFEKIVEGLVRMRREFKGSIWLEIMLVKGINDTIDAARRFSEIIRKVNPDKVQINLPVRPSSFRVLSPSLSNIERIRKVLGAGTEVVSLHYRGRRKGNIPYKPDRDILKIIKIRPVSVDELRYALGYNTNIIVKQLSLLKGKGMIKEKVFEGRVFFVYNKK